MVTLYSSKSGEGEAVEKRLIERERGMAMGMGLLLPAGHL